MKNKKSFICIILLLFITISFVTNNHLDNNKLFTSIINSKNYLQGNEITSLDTPTGLEWKEESTATAKWNTVANANYYLVNIMVYDGEDIVGIRESGTSNNELDLQQEIHEIIQSKSLESYQITFNVQAKYISDNNIVVSDYSEYSDLLSINKKYGIKLSTPEDVSIDNNRIARWSNIEDAGLYQVEYSMKYDNTTKTYTDLFIWKKDGTVKNGIFEIDLTNSINNAYKFLKYDGKPVEVSLKVMARASALDEKYIDGNYSVGSNTITYYISTKKLSTPVDVSIGNNRIAKWSNIEDAGLYQVEYSMKYDNTTKTYTDLFIWKKDGIVKNGMFEIDLTNSINNAYKFLKYDGKTVEVSLKVIARASANDNVHFDSDYSIKSNIINYYQDTKKLSTPVDVSIDNNKIARWSNVEDAGLYQVEYSLKDNNITKTYTDLFIWKRNGTVKNGIFTVDLRKSINEAYNFFKYDGKTVEVSLKVMAKALVNDNDHTDSDYSSNSNSIFYNPNGSTVIDNITLSPYAPVIAVGRSIYIGKTIQPENAYYSFINWSSSNSDIVAIDSMGKITGLKKGNATINAKINNATKSADVSVYEIESNIEDIDSSKEVIDTANEIIEKIISDSSTNNTDIENVNDAINEIESGAQDGHKFNVDINTEVKDKDEYISIEDEIKSKYTDMEIGGGYDVTIEISHEDNNKKKHHIGNITEFDNEIKFNIDIIDSLPELLDNKTREYKLVRYHNNKLENIKFNINDNNIETSSDKFSDFILLYKDIDIPVVSLLVDKNNISLNKGESETVNVTIMPENAANKNYIATSNNYKVATVKNNVITAVGAGSTVITFTSNDGNYSQDVLVNVKSPLNSISFASNTKYIKINSSKKLELLYNPIDTTDSKNILWSSDNNDVASIDEFGVVTGNNLGEANIKAIVNDKEASIKIVVTEYINGDMNRNGKVDLQDIIILLKKYLKTLDINEEDLSIGDMDDSGSITIKDIILLLRTYLNTN